MPNPLCFVLMPFGRKPSPIGGNHRFRCCLLTDHQARHRCRGTGSDPRRRGTGRRDHPRPMFERLILCEYAVTDLTAVNASRRHGLGPRAARAQPRRIGRGGGAGAARFDPGSGPSSEISAILGRVY